MHKITIYFVGGTSLTFDKCDEKTASNTLKWLNDDTLKTFTIDSHILNKTTLIRKDLVLFIDII